MIDRCTKPNHRVYSEYGGRGIDVCKRWLHFPNFVEDMGATFFEGSSIDRIDNDKGYSPQNCRWATAKIQTDNRRCSISIKTPWGKMSIPDAAAKLGMPRGRLATRIKLGWSYKELFDPKNVAAMTKWSRRGKRAKSPSR